MTLGLSDSSTVGRQPEGAGKWFARRRALGAFRKLGYKVDQLPSGSYHVLDKDGADAAFVCELHSELHFRIWDDENTIEIAYKFGVDVFHYRNGE
ncbi:MAG: hypothetical protein J4400_05335 [Candidatus Aenigmarchaeota archaeon]|nr:hypothetical protein [Candidatus Aenigmarchaeota archaeon]